MTTLLLLLAIVGLWAVQTAVILLHIKVRFDPIQKKLDDFVQIMESAEEANG